VLLPALMLVMPSLLLSDRSARATIVSVSVALSLPALVSPA
jgi:hypothetical protein